MLPLMTQIVRETLTKSRAVARTLGLVLKDIEYGFHVLFRSAGRVSHRKCLLQQLMHYKARTSAEADGRIAADDAVASRSSDGTIMFSRWI